MTSSLPIQVATGILCASWWRGSWYVLDHTLFPADTLRSGVASLTAGASLLAMKQYILSPAYNGTKILMRMLPPPKDGALRTRYLQTNRFIMLYGIGTACVLTWRGTWLLWDEAGHFVADAIKSWNQAGVTSLPSEHEASTTTIPKEHHHGESTLTDHPDITEPVLFYSGIVSHVVATVGLLYIGRFTSIMAPPANITIVLDTFIHGKGKSFARAVQAFTQLRR
ncbi:hypothetical protein ACHAWO_007508 [Cyclotella atomus]|uniref:Uncharacterized protein n=1 Tax=Cyclotella atomus TaxID=382360 RepID=A0ABD3MZI3_9STRA